MRAYLRCATRSVCYTADGLSRGHVSRSSREEPLSVRSLVACLANLLAVLDPMRSRSYGEEFEDCDASGKVPLMSCTP